MRFALVLIFATICAGPAPCSSSLLQVAIGSRELYRYEEFKSVIMDYIANDEQTMLVTELLTSSQYLIFYKKFIATPEMVNLINFLHSSGTKILQLVNTIHAFLGIPAFKPKKFSNIPKYAGTTGLEGVINKVLKIYTAKNIQSFLKTTKYDQLEDIVLEALTMDPEFVVQFTSLWAQLQLIPELKVIFNYMEDYGGMPFLSWMNSKAPLYGVPKVTRTTYTFTRTGGIMGLLNDILLLETPQLPQMGAYFANASATDAEFKTAFDLAVKAGNKLTEMRTTPQFVAVNNFFKQYNIDLIAVLDFTAFLMAKIISPAP